MIDRDERELLETTVRGAIADALADAGAGADIDGVLGKLGWLEMLEAEPGDALDIVFSALGAAHATATALDDVLVSALGQEPHPGLAVLLPPFGAWEPPGRLDADSLHARGLATARAARAGELLVVCGTASQPRWVTLPMQAAAVSAVRGVDPGFGFHSIQLRIDTAAASRLDGAAWESAVAVGRRAVAHQIAGASRSMLELARTHALERVQFGRPIARFQAVRHRLAEALVAVEALEATLAAARDEPSPDTAALAKATAGRTARTVATHCQQVLAGVGFTTEHAFHRFLKRTIALEGLFGTSDGIVVDLGRKLIAERRVPTLIEL